MTRIVYEWLKEQGHYIMRKIIIDRNAGEDLERLPEIPIAKPGISRLKAAMDAAEERRKKIINRWKR